MILYEALKESKADEFASWIKKKLSQEKKPRRSFKEVHIDIKSAKMWTSDVKKILSRLDQLKKENPKDASKIDEIKEEVKSWSKDPTYQNFKDIKRKKKSILSLLKKLGVGLSLGILVIAALLGIKKGLSDSIDDLEDTVNDDLIEYNINCDVANLLNGVSARNIVEDNHG